MYGSNEARPGAEPDIEERHDRGLDAGGSAAAGQVPVTSAPSRQPDELRALRAEVAELRAVLEHLVDSGGHVTCRRLTIEDGGGASVKIVVNDGAALVKVDNGRNYVVDIGAEEFEGNSLSYLSMSAEGMSGVTVSASPPSSDSGAPGQHRTAWGELQIFQGGGKPYIALADELTKTERVRTGYWALPEHPGS